MVAALARIAVAVAVLADGVATGPPHAPSPPVNCGFAQRLVQFDKIVQEEARAVLRSRVRAIVQLGTYNCRRMAAYPDLVSEHSLANAIDVAVFLFADGRRVDVDKHHKNHLHLDGATYNVDGT
ncbi:MAG: extensin family protein [Polyangia bacterium]